MIRNYLKFSPECEFETFGATINLNTRNLSYNQLLKFINYIDVSGLKNITYHYSAINLDNYVKNKLNIDKINIKTCNDIAKQISVTGSIKIDLSDISNNEFGTRSKNALEELVDKIKNQIDNQIKIIKESY